jgi:3-oxoacyl-[acyl-carrier protein] reductase
VSELEGRGAAWTEERGTSDEGRRRPEAPRQVAGEQSTSDEGRRRPEAPRQVAGEQSTSDEGRRRAQSAPPERGKQRAILVTGASRGIGRAIAEAFAAAGDRVAVHHRKSAGLAAEVVAGLPGDGHVAVQADLADPEAVRAMVDAAADQLGGIDVLVNNAGIFESHPITEVSYEEWQGAWQATLGVNLIGAANVTWCAVRHMTTAGRGGRIVNVSSRGAFRGEPGQPAYGASKAGLNALGQSLALALGPHGIAVTTVAPGYVDTEMATSVLAGPSGEEIRAQSPFGRVASPDEIAAAVLYLASPQAQWASGTIVDLNGASYLRP